MNNNDIQNRLGILSGNSGAFFLIAGPCVVESEEITLEIAARLCEITGRLGIPFVFKASYRKANRSRNDSFTGIGDDVALEILKTVRDRFHIPVLTDIHSAEEAPKAAQVADVLQIPAFLCRQSDLLAAAAATGKVVNIKKGQFLSAQAMGFAVEKVREAGNDAIWLTERGTTFGYGDLIVDFRSIPIMQRFAPVIVDVTHSVQRPNTTEGVTGGAPEMIETLARAAVAAGADGIFMETHPNPSKALSDGANMLPLDRVEALLTGLVALRNCVNGFEQ